MRDIKKISKIVELTLAEKPHTRNSDAALYMAVCRKINPIAIRLPFQTVMSDPTKFGLPKTESVRRARQKIQAENELLRANKEVEDERYKNWKAVREYVKE